ncbi:MAG TPA: hypothetical protein VFZ38_19430, partial [Vicinamibacterales bacterium]
RGGAVSGRNPLAGDVYAPLADDWAKQSISGWRVSPGPKPPPARTPPPPPRPSRPLAVKFTQQRLQIDATPRAILVARAERQYLLIQNATGSGVIYVGFDEPPDGNTGIEIIAGGSIELTDPAPSNQVFVVCPSGAATIRTLEG